MTSQLATVVRMQDVPQPGERAPAPGELARVQAFVNTVDLEDGIDQLGSPAALAAWLVDQGLAARPPRLMDADLRRALELREGLRELISGNTGQVVRSRTRRRLETITRSAQLRVDFADGRPTLAPAGTGLDGAIAKLLAIVVEAKIDGTWPRLKTCRRDVCRWAFYDGSRNRTGHWCTMRICGNRVKARQAYRRKVRAQVPSQTT
jgi:predicted RNA-binding Zn ribbon-like protein